VRSDVTYVMEHELNVIMLMSLHCPLADYNLYCEYGNTLDTAIVQD
jgi:hypothetical protein